MTRKEIKKLVDSDQAALVYAKTYLHAFAHYFDRRPFEGGLGAAIGNGFRAFDEKKFLVLIIEKDATEALAPHVI